MVVRRCKTETCDPPVRDECCAFDGFEFDEKERIVGTWWLVGSYKEVMRRLNKNKPKVRYMGWRNMGEEDEAS